MSEIKLPQLNQVLLAGRLTHDVEKKYTPSGAAVLNFSLAVGKSWKDKNGEWKEKTVFIGCVVWGKMAEIGFERLHKGSPVVVEGELDMSEWQAKDGTKRQQIKINTSHLQILEKQSQEPKEDKPVEPEVEEISL